VYERQEVQQMRLLLIAIVLVGALAHAAPAAAGCWATAGLAPPPKGTAAGETWTAEIKILQHGRNPLPDAANARPTVTILHEASGRKETFTAAPSDPQRGRYEAQVVFPFGGTWKYEVFDDFPASHCAQTHTFGSFRIDGPAGPSGAASNGLPLGPMLGAGGAVLVAIVGLVYPLRRRRSRMPAAA
jgi:hypothetical protein